MCLGNKKEDLVAGEGWNWALISEKVKGIPTTEDPVVPSQSVLGLD